ncbi:MAG: hypothetical protein H6733_17810 [Alphaproteobacteria bacterium]|nr:hypothetical protein [Alphaproteobacteria bacterium]
MTDDIDELFGSAGAPQPRTRLVVGLLLGGLAMAVLGMACSAVPGGLVVLGASAVADRELDRVESGYLPPTARAPLRRLKQATFLGMVVVGALFVVQLTLLSMGVYDVLWGDALRWAHDLWFGPTPAA